MDKGEGTSFMPVFVLPPRLTNSLTSKDSADIGIAVASALANVGSDAIKLLEEKLPDAYQFLTVAGNSHQQLWALRRLELCQLEVARRHAVQSPDFPVGMGPSLSMKLSLSVATAMWKEINIQDPNRDNCRLVVNGLQTLSKIEQQQSGTGDYERTFGQHTTQPTTNRSKGKKSRRRTRQGATA